MVMGGGGGKGVPGGGRKEEVGEGGTGAKALHPKGFRVPGGACCLGAVPALQTCSREAAPVRTSRQPSQDLALPRAGLLDPRPAATAQTPFFAGSGSVVRVWSPGGLCLLPGTAQSPGKGWGGGACRSAKLRHPRELGFGLRLEPSGIQASGKSPLAISKKNAAKIFSASPKLQGLP